MSVRLIILQAGIRSLSLSSWHQVLELVLSQTCLHLDLTSSSFGLVFTELELALSSLY